jgi:hypothetical protein
MREDDTLEKVQTVEDVMKIFEAGRRVKSLQYQFVQGVRENNPQAIWMHREMEKLRSEIHQKYRIII